MEVNAGFREVFFGPMGALEIMIESIKDPSKRESFVAEQGLFNGYTRLIDAALVGQTSARTIARLQQEKEHRGDQRVQWMDGSRRRTEG